MRTLLLILFALPVLAGRDFVGSSSQLAVGLIDPISPPLTFAAFIKTTQTTASVVPFSIIATTNTVERVQIAYLGSTIDVTECNAVEATGGATAAIGSSTLSANTITHVAGVVASATDRKIYFNGVQNGTSTTSRTVNGLDQVVIGATKSTSYTAFWTGSVYEAAVWTVALTASEILSLSQGAAPFMIRPDSLVFYAPLTGRETATEWNLVGAQVTMTNTPAIGTDHPRIYRP